MALWRKETLWALIDPAESPWAFEVQGTQRSAARNDIFLCVSKRRFGIDYVFTAIKNGYWTEQASSYAKVEELIIPFDELPHKPARKRICDHLKSMAYETKRKIQEKREK